MTRGILHLGAITAFVLVFASCKQTLDFDSGSNHQLQSGVNEHIQQPPETGNLPKIVIQPFKNGGGKAGIQDVTIIKDPAHPEMDWSFDQPILNYTVSDMGSVGASGIRVHLVTTEGDDLGEIKHIQGVGSGTLYINQTQAIALMSSRGAGVEFRYNSFDADRVDNVEPHFGHGVHNKGGGSFDYDCAVQAMEDGTIVAEVTAATSPASGEPASDFKVNSGGNPVQADANQIIAAALFSDPQRQDRCMISFGAAHFSNAAVGMDVLAQVEDGVNISSFGPVEDGNSDYYSLLTAAGPTSTILEDSIVSGTVNGSNPVSLSIGALTGDLTQFNSDNYLDVGLGAYAPLGSSKALINLDSTFVTGNPVMPEYYNQKIVTLEPDVVSAIGLSRTEEIIVKDISIDDPTCSYDGQTANAISSGYAEALLFNSLPAFQQGGMCAFGLRILANMTQTGTPDNVVFVPTEGDLLDENNVPIASSILCPYGYNLFKPTGDVFDVDGDGLLDLTLGGGSELDLELQPPQNRDDLSDEGIRYLRNLGVDGPNCNGIPQFKMEAVNSATSVFPGIYNTSTGNNANDDQVTDIRFVQNLPAEIILHSGADAFVIFTYANRPPRFYARDAIQQSWTEITSLGNFQADDRYAKGRLSYLGRGIQKDMIGAGGHVLGPNPKGVTKSAVAVGTRHGAQTPWHFVKVAMGFHPLSGMEDGIWHDIATAPLCATKKDVNGDPIYPSTASFPGGCRPCDGAQQWIECGPDAQPVQNRVGRVHNAFLGAAMLGTRNALPGNVNNGYDPVNHIPSDIFGDRTYYLWALEKE